MGICTGPVGGLRSMSNRQLHQLLPQSAVALGIGKSESPGFRPSKCVLIWLIDGMGYQNLANSKSDSAALPQLLADEPALAGYPSTTPVSLTSFGTGLPAGEHGVVGATFEVPEFDTLLKPLHWADSPDPIAIQPEPTWFENVVAAGFAATRIGPVAYAESGLTRAALRGGQHLAAESLAELVEQSAIAIARGGLVYGYYPTLDKRGHVYGTASTEFQLELELVLSSISQMQAKLVGDVEFVVTSDHGMLNIDQRIWAEDRPSLLRNARMIAGEPRLRHIYADPGQSSILLRDWQAATDVADIYSRDAFIETGWLGEVSDFARDRIGDVVAVARDNSAIGVRGFDARASSLKGMHGANSEVECQIPIARMAI